MRFIKFAALVIVGTLSALRGLEEAFALWVRRSVRVHGLSGLAEA